MLQLMAAQKVGYVILKFEKTAKKSIKTKHKNAGWNDSYMLH
jgi:hypothetical protein